MHVDYETYGDARRLPQPAIKRHFDAQDVDFMDGIIHTPDELVLCVGRFVDERAVHARSTTGRRSTGRARGTRRDDYLTTPDYFFRYDRGVTNVHPKSLLGRLLFGKLMDSGNDAAARRQAELPVQDRQARR